MRFVFVVSYDGTEYCGWQRQKNAVSVQEVLEKAVYDALNVNVNIMASGRTDAGVHAFGQVCQFDSDEITVPPDKLPDCLNRILPPDIKLVYGYEGDENFDCNRTAKRKTYRYTLYESARDIPLLERYAVRVEKLPEENTVRNVVSFMEGEHDYKAFCASGSSVKTTVRTVYEIKTLFREEYGTKLLDVFVTGNGFLYNMVRTMVGEMLDLVNGKRTVESLQQAFLTGNRALLGKTMPAKGLTLMKVEYKENKD